MFSREEATSCGITDRDSVVMVSKAEAIGRNARPVATVATRAITEFTTRRHEMRATAQRVPAAV